MSDPRIDGVALAAALALAAILSWQVEAREGDDPPASAWTSVDRCETTDAFAAETGPYGQVVLSAGAFEAKEGGKCLRMEFREAQVSYVRFRPGVAWGDNTHLVFWLRAVGEQKHDMRLRLQADAEDGAFAINMFIPLDFDGWARVRLAKQDFDWYPGGSGGRPDWAQIRAFTFGQMQGADKPTIFIDDIGYEKAGASTRAPVPDVVPVADCDAVDRWRATGVTLRAAPEQRVEGAAALAIAFAGGSRGAASTPLAAGGPRPGHALALFLRGPGIETKLKLSVVLRTPDGGAFRADVPIRDFEMDERVLFPGGFHEVPAPGGAATRWEDVRTFALELDNSADVGSGVIIVDDVRFVSMAAAAPRAIPDERFYWWDGGFDPYACMHVAYADWPHLAADERPGADGEPTVLRVSDSILSPLAPYTIHLHNDGRFARFRVTVTDWAMNPVDVLDVESAGAGVTRRDLVAPPRAGTLIFNVACFDATGTVVRRYQTGVTVLAKRLAEPRGIWGVHGYLGSKGGKWPHHEQVLDLFRATGIMLLRERVHFVHPDTAGYGYMRGPERRVLQLAKKHGMQTIVSVYLRASRHLFSNTRREAPGMGIAPGKRPEVEAIMQSLAAYYRGLVDWWEIDNELNERPFAPYAEILAACYESVKRGDPAARVTMCGCHVLDQPASWQVQAWEMERAAGINLQDALATHLYPDPGALEDTLRRWIAAQGGALVEEGMLMTEGGWSPVSKRTQALLEHGMVPEGISGERESQEWNMRYAPIMLGEHMKMGAKLHGVGFFRSTPSMGSWFLKDGELRLHAAGIFAARWQTREITMGRPLALTHNTIARLLTHEVMPADVAVDYDRSAGKIEHYAFARPGETIVALWVGVHAGGRADALEATFAAPASAGLALLVDMDGNERVVDIVDGAVTLRVKHQAPRYLRLIDGRVVGDVFLQDLAEAVPAAQVVAGTPAGEPRIAAGIARDRNLPVVSDVVPLPGRPMVLLSLLKEQDILYVVGQTDEDVARALAVYRYRTLRPARY